MFGDAEYKMLLAARHGSVAVISLNRVSARNALDGTMRAELRDAFAAAERDAGIRAVLVTAEGDGFCAGGDIRDLQARTAVDAAWSPERIDVAVEQLSKPVVGALHGYVLGGGLELALAFTLRIGADNLRCALPEIELGIFPALGGTQRLPRLIGEARALDLILTGRTVEASEALALGLVTRVVPVGELRTEALKLAQRLADGPPIATRVAIEAVRRASDLGRHEGLDYERRLFGLVCSTEDKSEGIAAWRDKRRPKFTGR
jgi:enoyl-CoA hydratase/carnithine racemase